MTEKRVQVDNRTKIISRVFDTERRNAGYIIGTVISRLVDLKKKVTYNKRVTQWVAKIRTT